MTLKEFNKLDEEVSKQQLLKCCGAEVWAQKMTTFRPYQNISEMMHHAEEEWWRLTSSDWLEAFDQHPRIGNIDTLRAKFASTKDWAANEQSDVADDEAVIKNLAELNDRYYDQFGFIFIVYATGKTASQMSELLILRLKNSLGEEINIAAQEQLKITKLRLTKLFDQANEL